MPPTLPNQFDTTASAVTNLSQALQDPDAENLLTYIEADIHSMNSQVSEVDILLDQLPKYRATLQHNLNLRVSRICAIPPETLGEIFKYVCDNPYSISAITPRWLGAICHHWRQVAWSVPQLWTDLIFGEGFWESRYQARLLKLYFKNIGGLRCSITFPKVPEEEGGEDPQRIPQKAVFDLLFVKSPHKVKELIFHNTPEVWLLHINNVTKSGRGLPNLESFWVLDEGTNGIYGPGVSPFALYNVPQLRKLVLESVAQTLIFPWAQLTELRFLCIDSAATLNIVFQCENLVTLKLYCLSDSNGTPVALPRGPVVLRSLRRFNYDGSLSSSWEKALIECLSFPSLKRLDWEARDESKKFRKAFLLRLPTSLTRLEIECRGERVDIDDLKIVFARLTSLRSVTLCLDDPLEFEVVRLIMVADRRHFLPSLQSVVFIMIRPEYSAQQISDLLNIVRSRWVMPGGEDLFQGPKFSFPHAQKDSVKRLEDWIMREDM